jgi:hypothetical protein
MGNKLYLLASLFERYCSFISLGTMNLEWKNLPHGVRKRLVIDLEDSKGHGFNEFDLSVLLKGCELLGYGWNERNGTRNVILSAFTNIFSEDYDSDSSREFLSCLYYFTMNGMKWKYFPEEAKTALFKGIRTYCGAYNSKHLSNMLYG